MRNQNRKRSSYYDEPRSENREKYNNKWRFEEDRHRNKHVNFKNSSRYVWHKKAQSESSSYHRHIVRHINWKEQQEEQKQKALKALKVISTFNRIQENSQSKTETFQNRNISQQENPSTSKSGKTEKNTKRIDKRPNEQNNKKSPPDPKNIGNSTQSDATDQVIRSLVDNTNTEKTCTLSCIAKDTENSGNIKTEIEKASTEYNENQDGNLVLNLDRIDHMVESENNINLSLIPISLLLKEEPTDLVLEAHFEELKKQFETHRAEKETHSETAEQFQSTSQTQDPEKLSEKLVNRVITMDRISIKQLINNPDSKFDAALKLRARKRLREEIRKQLRHMNLSTTCEGRNDKFCEPDEFVDSGQIPVAIINEIRKTFGIEFLEQAGITTNENETVELRHNETLPDIVGDTTKKTVGDTEKDPKQHLEKPKTDLMTRLKNLESIKANCSKSTEKCPTENKMNCAKTSSTNEIVAVNTSSESSDNSNNSGTSDSDSDSSSSSTSNCSSISRRKKRKQKQALEENVVNSFKTLILPKLTKQQRGCFEKKSSSGVLESLTYIYDICLNKISKKIILGNYERKILKKNLRSSNNEEALQFLIKNIKELFEQDKIDRRSTCIKTDYKKNATKAKNQTAKTVLDSKSKSPQKLSDENQQILFNAANEIPGIKPSKDYHPPDESANTHPRCQHINEEKVPTESKTAQSAVGGVIQQPASTEGNKSGSNASGNDYNKAPSNVVAPVRLEATGFQSDNTERSDKTPTNTRDEDTFQNNMHSTAISIDSSSSEIMETDSKPRSWKSPGEKKCLQPFSTDADSSIDALPELSLDNFNSYSQSNSFLSDIDTMNISTTLDINQTENLRILSLIQQNKISEAVLNNLKEIDFKLMELHKRKMYIEEMILKLQKDKMAIDLNTMKLQNEKFVIISSAAAKSNITVPPQMSLYPQTVKSETLEITGPKSNGKNKKKKGNESRTPFSTPFSEKLKNRKKRCQRDILLEDTANTLCNDNQILTNLIRHSSPDEISENVDDIFQRKRRKVTKKANPSDIIENKSPSTSQIKICNVGIDKFPEKNYTPKLNTEQQNFSGLEETPSEYSQDESALEVEEDYSGNNSFNLNNSDVPNGNFEGFKLPISQIRVSGEFVIAASEDGHVYKFNWKTKQLLSKFVKHTETVTQILIDSNKYVYSTSLDGYMKKTSVENFGLEIQSVNTQEPLQTIELQWNTAFIGSRWGNVFTYNIKKNKLADTLLCSVGSSIMALKAAKEGARKVLIVASKGNQINVRDATSGLLLRTIEVPPNINIYSILLNESLLYCGSSKNEIFTYDFTAGSRVSVFVCGNGVVSMKVFRKKFIFAGCYDGFVYVLNKTTGCQIGRFPGCGKVILAMDIVGEKLLTSSKDNSMQLMDIPKYILALNK